MYKLYASLFLSKAENALRKHSTMLPVVIESLTWMSYVVSVDQNLGLGFSGLYLQTSWLQTDVKISVIDNEASLVKGLPVNALRY
jgi:hypothetical protein